MAEPSTAGRSLLKNKNLLKGGFAISGIMSTLVIYGVLQVPQLSTSCVMNGFEEKLDELRQVLGKADGDLLRIVGVGASAWGSVFAALLQDSLGVGWGRRRGSSINVANGSFNGHKLWPDCRQLAAARESCPVNKVHCSNKSEALRCRSNSLESIFQHKH